MKKKRCMSLVNHFRKLSVDYRSDDLHHKSCKMGIIGFSRWVERLFSGHDCLCKHYVGVKK